MSVLEDYEKRFHLAALTADQITDRVEYAEGYLKRCQRPTTGGERVIVWLSDRLQAVYAALENRGIPVASRCAWCFCAGPQTHEAWNALPNMTLDDAAAHSQVCDYNPLVRNIRELQAQIEELRGRVFPAPAGPEFAP